MQTSFRMILSFVGFGYIANLESSTCSMAFHSLSDEEILGCLKLQIYKEYIFIQGSTKEFAVTCYFSSTDACMHSVIMVESTRNPKPVLDRYQCTNTGSPHSYSVWGKFVGVKFVDF